MAQPTTQTTLKQSPTSMNTMLMYGPMGSGKTSALAAIARSIYKETGKKTRLISGDGGGFDPVGNLIDLGIIEPAAIGGRKDILPTLQDLARGDWFIDGELVKPNAKSKSGKVNDLSTVGLYVVEGTKFIGQTMLNNLLGKGINFTDKNLVTDFTANQDDTNEVHHYGLPVFGHYGFTQNYVTNVIFSFLSLIQSTNSMLIFTTHEYEDEGDSKQNRKPITGPASTGKALVGSLPSMFGRVIHMTKLPVKNIVKSKTGGSEAVFGTEYRAYFRPHRDQFLPTSWEATLRFSPEERKTIVDHKEWNELWEQGYVVIGEVDTVGVMKLLNWKKEVKEATNKRLLEELNA